MWPSWLVHWRISGMSPSVTVYVWELGIGWGRINMYQMWVEETRRPHKTHVMIARNLWVKTQEDSKTKIQIIFFKKKLTLSSERHTFFFVLTCFVFQKVLINNCFSTISLVPLLGPDTYVDVYPKTHTFTHHTWTVSKNIDLS